jgi:hypothetical protein
MQRITSESSLSEKMTSSPTRTVLDNVSVPFGKKRSVRDYERSASHGSFVRGSVNKGIDTQMRSVVDREAGSPTRSG